MQYMLCWATLLAAFLVTDHFNRGDKTPCCDNSKEGFQTGVSLGLFSHVQTVYESSKRKSSRIATELITRPMPQLHLVKRIQSLEMQVWPV